ncbi:zinc-ribbon domain-containing protein [Candidatus Poseidoniaceae archaeon]|nr:zinc-ribbon domain-containing protein [Candidatus Poseidoniaceae archaeon]
MDVDEVLAELLPQVPENIFSKWLTQRISLTWLELSDDRLGMTRFEEGPAELVRRRRFSLDPGNITIGLHPRLKEEPDLLRHTLAHELVHASGVLNHSKELHDAVDSIAPGVAISDSPVLQEMRDEFLGSARVKSWTCSHCGYEWKRATVRKPKRCHKCARPL